MLTYLRGCLTILKEKEKEKDVVARPNQYKPCTNNRRKKVLELQHLSREMGLDSCLCPLVMDSCKVALTGGKQQVRWLVFAGVWAEC